MLQSHKQGQIKMGFNYSPSPWRAIFGSHHWSEDRKFSTSSDSKFQLPHFGMKHSLYLKDKDVCCGVWGKKREGLTSCSVVGHPPSGKKKPSLCSNFSPFRQLFGFFFLSKTRAASLHVRIQGMHSLYTFVQNYQHQYLLHFTALGSPCLKFCSLFPCIYFPTKGMHLRKRSMC